MLTLSQGNIFAAVADRRADLAVIFGHIGFNEMHESWRGFSASVPTLSNVRDPFSEIAGKAHPIADNQWLWFVAEHKNHGMSDSHLIGALEPALSWAASMGLKSVATNGIAATDHGVDTASNRASDDRRALFLLQYATKQEQATRIGIELISLNDVFVRNSPGSCHP